MVNEVSRWTPFPASTPFRYAAALAVTVLALLGRWLLDPFLGNYTPYILLYGAVALCAIYAGFGPSILAALLGLIGANYWFVPPRGSLALAFVGRWPLHSKQRENKASFGQFLLVQR